MVENQQAQAQVQAQAQIQAQRTAIEQAKKQAQAIAKREQYSKAQLLSKQRGLASRAQRQAQQQLKQKASRQQLAQVRTQESAFETEVSKKVPEYAQTKYLESSYAKAKTEIEKKVTNLTQRLSVAQEKYQKAVKRDDEQSEDNYRDNINILKAELGVYESSLKDPKTQMVKSHYSGYITSMAKYQKEKESDRISNRERKKSFAESQGFSSYSQYDKAYKEQQKLVNAPEVPGIISPAYTDSLRQGMSVDPSKVNYNLNPSNFLKQFGGTGATTPFDFNQKQSISPTTLKEFEKKDLNLNAPTPLSVTLPLSETERLKESIEQTGYIKGSLNYGAEAVGRGVKAIDRYRLANDPTYRSYQTEATANLFSSASRIAPYFSPVGAEIMILEGGEMLATKKGQEKLKENVKYYTDVKGYSPITSSVLAYGEPVLEIGLGSTAKVLKFSEIKKFKDLEKANPEISLGVSKGNQFEVISTRKTPKMQSYTKQTYEVLDSGQVVKGKGSTIIKDLKTGELSDPNKFTFSGEVSPTEARKIKEFALKDSNIKIITDIKTPASEGRVQILTQDLKKYNLQIAGFSQDIKGGSKIIYGEIPKGRYYKKTPKEYEYLEDIRTGETFEAPIYEKSLKGRFEPQGVGFIKKIGAEEETGIKTFVGGGKKSPNSFFKQLYAEPELIAVSTEQKIISGVRVPKTPSLISPTIDLLKSKTSQIPVTSQRVSSFIVEKENQVNFLKPLQTTKTTQESVLKPLLKTEQTLEPITKQKVSAIVIPKQDQIPFLASASKLKIIQKTTQETIPKTISKTIQKPSVVQKPFILEWLSSKKPRSISQVQTKKSSGDYKSYIKRFGKWKPVSTGSKQKAIKQAREKVRRTLGASYRVKNPKGKFIKLPITKEFRRSKNKKTPFALVEKSKYRLNSASEKAEIKRSRK